MKLNHDSGLSSEADLLTSKPTEKYTFDPDVQSNRRDAYSPAPASRSGDYDIQFEISFTSL